MPTGQSDGAWLPAGPMSVAQPGGISGHPAGPKPGVDRDAAGTVEPAVGVAAARAAEADGGCPADGAGEGEIGDKVPPPCGDLSALGPSRPSVVPGEVAADCRVAGDQSAADVEDGVLASELDEPLSDDVLGDELGPDDGSDDDDEGSPVELAAVLLDELDPPLLDRESLR